MYGYRIPQGIQLQRSCGGGFCFDSHDVDTTPLELVWREMNPKFKNLGLTDGTPLELMAGA